MVLIILMIVINAIFLALIGLSKTKWSRKLAIAASAISLIISLILAYSVLSAGVAYSESYGTLSNIGISLSFNVSGISAALILMSTIVLLVTIVSGNPEKEGV